MDSGEGEAGGAGEPWRVRHITPHERRYLVTAPCRSHKTFVPLSLPNRNLQAEYDRLKQQHDHKGLSPLPSPPEMMPVSPQSPRDAELIAEAKLLRQHKGRLEARMQILEDHNKQLESQLHRLRQLLEQVSPQAFLLGL